MEKAPFSFLLPGIAGGHRAIENHIGEAWHAPHAGQVGELCVRGHPDQLSGAPCSLRTSSPSRFSNQSLNHLGDVK